MTVSTAVPGNSYTAGAGATVFAYTFRAFSSSDLAVYVNGVAKALTTDYSVSGVDAAGGGNVTFVTPMVGAEIVVISSNAAIKRATDYQEGGDLLGKTHNDDHDYPIILLKQIAGRALMAPISEPWSSLVLPAAATRAGNMLVFDVAGNAAIAPLAGGAVVWVPSLLLTGGTLTGPVNETMKTVSSHATAADIWGASASNVIYWTGTATTSIFPNAPVAGARRLLYCSGACSFVTGANLLIRGIPSGTTITLKAGAFVWVTALTVSKFQVDYELDGSFTATGTGFTAGVTATWYYAVRNGNVLISSRGNYLNGTSNTTDFTVTGFPAEITPTGSRQFYARAVADNGVLVDTGFGVLANTGILTLYPTVLAGSWTASGNKLLYPTDFHYQL